MSKIFKGLLYTLPLVALVLYYVIAQQSKHDTQMQVQDTKFERDWYEFEKDMAKTKENKEKFQKRINDSEEEIAKAKAEMAKKEEKHRKMEADIDKAMTEFEKEQEGKK